MKKKSTTIEKTHFTKVSCCKRKAKVLMSPVIFNGIVRTRMFKKVDHKFVMDIKLKIE